MLGSLIIYLKGMRRMMFQLSGFHYKGIGAFRGVGVQGLGLSLFFANRAQKPLKLSGVDKT